MQANCGVCASVAGACTAPCEDPGTEFCWCPARTCTNPLTNPLTSAHCCCSAACWSDRAPSFPTQPQAQAVAGIEQAGNQLHTDGLYAARVRSVTSATSLSVREELAMAQSERWMGECLTFSGHRFFFIYAIHWLAGVHHSF